MARKKFRGVHAMGDLRIEKGRLYWKDQPVVTEEKITLSKWVNFAIILGAISTALYALVTLLTYLKNCN